MSEIKIKDISYKDYINKDKIFTTIKIYHILDVANPFIVKCNTETLLRLETSGKIMNYGDDDAFFVFDSINELKEFTSYFIDKHNIYVYASRPKNNFKNEKSFEDFKESLGSKNIFWMLEDFYRKEIDMNKFTDYIVNQYFLEDLMDIKKSFDYIRDVYKVGGIELCSSKSAYLTTIEETVYDFKNLFEKLYSVFVNTKHISSMIKYIEDNVEEIDFDDLLDCHRLALKIADELELK